MKCKPNISQLYQKKYIAETPQNMGYSLALPLGEQAITRYGQLSQRLYCSPRKASIRCIKITKKQDSSEVTKLRADSLPLTEHYNHIIAKPNKASQPRQRQSELLRQLMKLSQQQLSQFQLSVGGENKLLKTLKSFFYQRNKNKQEEKLKMTKSDFRPVKNIPDRYDKKPMISRERQRNSREKERINRRQIVSQVVKLGEKDLAPWQIGENQIQ